MDDNKIEEMKKQLQSAMQQRDAERFNTLKTALDKVASGLDKATDLGQSQTQLNQDNSENAEDLQNVVDLMKSGQQV